MSFDLERYSAPLVSGSNRYPWPELVPVSPTTCTTPRVPQSGISRADGLITFTFTDSKLITKVCAVNILTSILDHALTELIRDVASISFEVRKSAGRWPIRDVNYCAWQALNGPSTPIRQTLDCGARTTEGPAWRLATTGWVDLSRERETR